MEWEHIKYWRTLWRIIRPKPKFLYKYHSVNSHFSEMIEKGAFWASSASNLNDPYDCDFELTNTFFKKKYLDPISFQDIGINSSTPQLEEQFFEGLASAFDETMMKSFQQHYKSQMGVCCFSASSVSELMWSHYANSGKGICLEFSFRKNPELEKKIIPIVYSNKSVKVINEIDRFKALFQKRIAWTYEKEWRMLGKVGRILFQKPDLIGIILGPRITQEDVKFVLEQCKKYDYNIRFSICNYTKNGLEIKILD